MSLAHVLLRHAQLTPDNGAIFNGTALHATYGQWATRSAALAQRLQAAGLAPGDRVVLFMRNHPRYLEILWAAWWAGLVVVPVNAKLHTREVEWIIDNAQARGPLSLQMSRPGRWPAWIAKSMWRHPRPMPCWRRRSAPTTQ